MVYIFSCIINQLSAKSPAPQKQKPKTTRANVKIKGLATKEKIIRKVETNVPQAANIRTFSTRLIKSEAKRLAATNPTKM